MGNKIIKVTSLDRHEQFQLYKELTKIVECSEKHFQNCICKLAMKDCKETTIKGVKFIKVQKEEIKEFNVITYDSVLINFFNKDILFKKVLTPCDDIEYMELKNEICAKYGEKNFKVFQKLVNNELKQKGVTK